METSKVGAIAPTAGFRRLLTGAMVAAEGSAVMLLSEDDTDRQQVWSWWRRGRDELYLPVHLEAALRGWNAIPVRCLP